MNVIALLDTLGGWWTGLTVAKQIFYGVAIFATGLAVLQAILLMIGVDGHDALDAHDVFDGGSIFSVKPLTGFFLGFGWAGGLALDAGLGAVAASGVAIASGVALLFGVIVLLRSLLRLGTDGTMKIERAVGTIATVYVGLPANRAAGGQVIATFDGRQETFEALNVAVRGVPSGEKVKVTQVLDSRTLLVEPLN